MNIHYLVPTEPAITAPHYLVSKLPATTAPALPCLTVPAITAPSLEYLISRALAVLLTLVCLVGRSQYRSCRPQLWL